MVEFNYPSLRFRLELLSRRSSVVELDYYVLSLYLSGWSLRTLRNYKVEFTPCKCMRSLPTLSMFQGGVHRPSLCFRVEFTDSLGRSRTVMRRDLAEYRRRDREGRRPTDEQVRHPDTPGSCASQLVCDPDGAASDMLLHVLLGD